MKALYVIKKIIYSSTFIFTVTMFTLALFYIFTQEEASLDTRGIQMDKYLPLYIFSLVLAALDHLLTCKKIHLAIRLPIHFIGTLTSIYVVFINVLKLGQTNHGRFSVMLLLTIVYSLVLGVCYLVRVGFLRLCGVINEASNARADTRKAKAEALDK